MPPSRKVDGGPQRCPDDEEAQETLLESLRRKLDLFHNTLMLMRDLERGDGATARDRINAISGRERRIRDDHRTTTG